MNAIDFAIIAVIFMTVGAALHKLWNNNVTTGHNKAFLQKMTSDYRRWADSPDGDGYKRGYADGWANALSKMQSFLNRSEE